MRVHILVFCLLLPYLGFAQLEPVPLLRSFALAYENDILKAEIGLPTDYYYTGGTFLEVNLPSLQRSPTSKLLLRLPGSYDESYGISLNSLGFTPTNTESDTVVTGDRPFAGTIYLGLNRTTCIPNKTLRLTSRLDVGAIGPVAGAYETQKFIHEHTNNAAPRGWQFQIKNDLYLNYSTTIEKGLALTHNAEIIGFGKVNAGTIYTNASVGLKLQAGRLRPHFFPPGYSDRFNIWIYANAEFKVVGYDATLQGGLFNNGSPYVISSGKIKRSVILLTPGIVITYHKFRLEYFNTVLTPEFEGGLYHAWGHFGVQFLF